MKNQILKFGLWAFLWMVYTLPAIAQPDDPPTDEDPWEEPDPTPIDNWVLLLILAGVAVGVYFVVKYRRRVAA